MTLEIKLKLEREYGLSFDVPLNIRDMFAYSSPESIVPHYKQLMFKQNEEQIETRRNELEERITKVTIPEVCEQLSIESLPSPEVRTRFSTNLRIECLFDRDTGDFWLAFSPEAVLRYFIDGNNSHTLRHELGHYVMLTQNPDHITADQNEFRRTFHGQYGKGFFLEESIAQEEGFAQWLAGRDKKYLNTHQELTSALPEREWDRLQFLRRVFDNPYEFGAIVYNTLAEARGIEAVKELAFGSLATREQMIDLYINCCRELGLTPVVPMPRHKQLWLTYQEMLSYGAIEIDNALEATLQEVDDHIEELLTNGKEPTILMHNPNSVLLDILNESYWHHGATMFSVAGFHERLMIKKNVMCGDIITVSDEMETGKWNILIDSQCKLSAMKEEAEEYGVRYLLGEKK